jgi:hypothetical protein
MGKWPLVLQYWPGHDELLGEHKQQLDCSASLRHVRLHRLVLCNGSAGAFVLLGRGTIASAVVEQVL